MLRFAPPSTWPSVCRALAVTTALGWTACATSPHASFQGVRAPRVASTEQLEQHTYVPHDHTAVGTVSASCQPNDDAGDRDRCSELELLRSMRQRAAEVGGTAFVAPSCRYAEGASGVRSIRCSATVARHTQHMPPGAEGVDTPAPQQRRWRVRVEGRSVRITALPRAGVTPSPRPVEETRRLWDAAPGAQRLGTVQSACLERCQRAEAALALLHGAAWLGADAIAKVRCLQSSAGRWTCTGDAVVAEQP